MTEDIREVTYRRRLLNIMNKTVSLLDEIEYIGTEVTDEDIRKLDYVMNTLNSIDVAIELPF